MKKSACDLWLPGQAWLQFAHQKGVRSVCLQSHPTHAQADEYSIQASAKGNDSSLVGNRRTIDLPKLKEQPEAAQLLHSLLAYAASAAFQPAQAVDFMLLKRLLGIDVVCD